MHNPAEAAPTGVPRPNHLRKPCDGSCHNCHKRDRRTRSDRAAGSSRRFWPAASTRRRPSRDASSAPGEVSPQHTALLGDWAIGKTTLLMHWRRLRRQAGDAVVLTMAYPLTPDQFLSSLVVAIEAELATDWSGRLDLEVGLDLGVADARLRRPARSRDQELRATMRRLVDQRGGDDRAVVVFVDDIDLVSGPGDVLLQLRASALGIYDMTQAEPKPELNNSRTRSVQGTASPRRTSRGVTRCSPSSSVSSARPIRPMRIGR